VKRLYEGLGEQYTVEFIFLLESPSASDEFHAKVVELLVFVSKLVKYEVDKQYQKFFAKLFPPSIPSLTSQQSRLKRELSIHIHQYHNQIIPTQYPSIEPPFWMKTNLEWVERLRQLVCKMYDVFLHVVLNPQLEFGELSEFTKGTHKCPYHTTQPLAVLPPLVHENKLVSVGYGY
jgi:hypothetical protein